MFELRSKVLKKKKSTYCNTFYLPHTTQGEVSGFIMCLLFFRGMARHKGKTNAQLFKREQTVVLSQWSIILDPDTLSKMLTQNYKDFEVSAYHYFYVCMSGPNHTWCHLSCLLLNYILPVMCANIFSQLPSSHFCLSEPISRLSQQTQQLF